jgi:hypothetical protein
MKMGTNGIIKGSRLSRFCGHLTTSFALDKGKPRESVGRKATGLSRFCFGRSVLVAELPNCDDYEGKTMITIRIGRVAACLTLTLVNAVLSGALASAARADVVQAPGKVNTSAAAKPVVKLGEAMLQERKTLPNGTVKTQTTLLSAKPRSAKAGPKSDPARKSGKA